MQTIEVILIAQMVLVCWFELVTFLTTPRHTETVKMNPPLSPRLSRLMLEYPKPLFCQFCLGYWTAILLSIIFLNPLLLGLFLLNLTIIKLR